MKSAFKTLIAVFATFSLLFSNAQPFVFAEETATTFHKVMQVIDGDTIQVNIEGKIQKIRLIGIDTPESVKSQKPECFGQEAFGKAKELLKGKRVRLESDSTGSDQDIFDRLLRYVYLENGTFINEYMVKEGYARAYLKFPFTYKAQFKQYEKEAKAAKKGLWNPEKCPSKEKAKATNNTKKCPIKGNINSKGEKIYHLSSGVYYKETDIDESKGEKWFCTEKEAKAAGWKKSKR